MGKVQAGNFTFLDFSDYCPICGGTHCAVRIGFYYRWVIDYEIETGTIIFLRIPIPRYLCKGINKPQHKHKTFSLLPDTLIAYNQLSIDMMMFILQLLVTEEYITPTLDKLDSITPGDIFFSEKMITHLIEIMEQSRIKLILFFTQHNETYRAPPDFHTYTVSETIKYILCYPVPAHQHPVKGAYYLSVLYYQMQGSYYRNSRFLFGTPSQFCR